MQQGNIEFLVDKLFDLHGFRSATRSSAYGAEVVSFCDKYLADMAPFAEEFGGLLSVLKQRLTELLLLHGEKRWKRLEMLEGELQGRIAESFCSCSHGAGRAMSRSEAKRTITLTDHKKATEGIECRKDSGVIDESPAAYKDISAVIAAQSSLVEVVHRLRQVVNVKG